MAAYVAYSDTVRYTLSYSGATTILLLSISVHSLQQRDTRIRLSKGRCSVRTELGEVRDKEPILDGAPSN